MDEMFFLLAHQWLWLTWQIKKTTSRLQKSGGESETRIRL